MVNSRNADQLIAQWLGGPETDGSKRASTAPVSEGNGRAFTRTTYRDEAGRALAENWLVHDAGHAGLGGGAAGSFTDAAGAPPRPPRPAVFFKSIRGWAGGGAGRPSRPSKNPPAPRAARARAISFF